MPDSQPTDETGRSASGDQGGSATPSTTVTRRGLLAVGTASLASLAGCSMLGGGGGSSNTTTSLTTQRPAPVNASLFSSVSLETGDLQVQLGQAAQDTVTRLALVGPVTGGGDTAQKGIHPGVERLNGDAVQSSGTQSPNFGLNQSSGPALRPKDIPRRPVFRTLQLSGSSSGRFTLLREEFGRNAKNYKSGMYYLVAVGKSGILAQRRLSLVPILTVTDASVGSNGELDITLKNAGTGPAYPAYATVIGAVNRNTGNVDRVSGGNGIIADSFILPPTQSRDYRISPQQDSPVSSPFSYPRSNATASGRSDDFDAESTAYCTGTGEYSHGLAVILGLVSGGYVGVRFSVTLGGQPQLVDADPKDKILCESLTVTSSLPRQFKPVRWPSGRKVLLNNGTDNGSENGRTTTGNNGANTTTGSNASTSATTPNASPSSTTGTDTTGTNATNATTGNVGGSATSSVTNDSAGNTTNATGNNSSQ